ncbi:MAG TPA: class I SAM-dependent methyltransferase [Solirubrobacterales bacterium]|nr:class I SAM-dependent methyltransferase [Solirubrobacterales bacterium]
MEIAAEGESGADWAERTYEAMAPVYDDFTAHHEYDAWIADLLVALERRGLRGRRLLDVGCGTGKSFMPMLPRGWEVTACDISAAMLELAREKAGESVRLEVADMLKLPRFGEFDLVWAIDDTVNYLLSREELERALAGMRANLAPTGLLLFDVNELLAYRTFFAETIEVEREGRRLVWKGLADADVVPGSICESRLEVASDEVGTDSAPAMTHRQRHFPEAEVLGALEAAGLECVDVYGIYTDGILKQPLDPSTHTKAIYIARAAGP